MVSWGHRNVVLNMILPVIFIIKSLKLSCLIKKYPREKYLSCSENSHTRKVLFAVYKHVDESKIKTARFGHVSGDFESGI